MAFCNVNQYKAKELFKLKNINNRSSGTDIQIFGVLCMEYA